jgi:hypothetical protein
VSAVSLAPGSQKEALAILAQTDLKHLEEFAKNYGGFSVVMGIPTNEEGWPGFLGGGFKGLFNPGEQVVFDNLQWTDRIYLSFAILPPPPAPFKTDLPVVPTPSSSTPNNSGVPIQLTLNPAPTPSVVRVEILNGCGITNAADWVARRMKGPGIIITATGNADNFHYPKTIIQTAAGLPVALEEALDRLGLSKDSLQETTGLSSSVDVVVIIGKDFPKLRERNRERNRHRTQ